MKDIKRIMILMTAGAVAILSSGCSTTGWSSKETVLTANIPEGELITVVQKNGTLSKGEFVAMENLPISEYMEEYTRNTKYQHDSKYLPAIGQTVQFSTSLDDKKVWEGVFLGFDDKNLLVKIKGKPAGGSVYFTSLTFLSGRYGDGFGRSLLRKMYIDGDIPLMYAVALKSDNQILHIPVSNIESLKIDESDDRMIGFVRESSRLRARMSK